MVLPWSLGRNARCAFVRAILLRHAKPTPKNGIMLLATFVDQIYLPSRVSVSDRYAGAMRLTIRQFSEYLGHPADVADLSEVSIASHLSAMSAKYRAASINSFRGRLLAVWREAADRGFVDRLPVPKRIRRLREELQPPEAWTFDEVVALIETARRQSGMVGIVPASAWWTSLLLVVYWTASRIGSLLAVPCSAYDGRGLLIAKQKNRRGQWHELPASCCREIEATDISRPGLLWACPWDRRTVWAKFRRLVEAAGVSAPPGDRQLFHRLRRSSISLIAAVDRNAAQRIAGHSSWIVTETHYVDPRLARQRPSSDILPDPFGTPIYKSGNFRIYG